MASEQWPAPFLAARFFPSVIVPKLHLGTITEGKLYFASEKDVKDLNDLNDQKDTKDPADPVDEVAWVRRVRLRRGCPNVPL